MVAEVFADAGQFVDDRYADLAEQRSRADAGAAGPTGAAGETKAVGKAGVAEGWKTVDWRQWEWDNWDY